MSTASRGRPSNAFLALAAILAPLSLPAAPAEDLREIGPCAFVATDWADGDSFLVRLPDGKQHVLRLYFVDCVERDVADTTGKRRLREQARHFGIEDYSLAVEFGRKAATFTAEALSRPFTIHTTFANAPGRSGKPRHYAFVTTAEGRDLGQLLVEKGLARAFGLGRRTPDGTPRDDWAARLADLELAAALRGTGLWKHCDPEKLVALREEQRAELRALEAIDDALAVAPPSSPVDVNSASLEDLTRSGLRESVADQVIKQRPFASIDDLIQVRGIGPVTLEKVRPHLTIDPSPSETERKAAP